MSFESKTTKEAKTEIKKKKEKTTMKNSINWTVVKTVITTLVILAALATSFYQGIKYEQGINDRVNNEVKSLTATVKPSKQ